MKYSPEMVQKVHDYLQTTGKEQMHLPKIQSLALFLGVNRDTLYTWEKEHEEFKEALEIVRMKQAEQLIDDGIYGGKEVNAAIVKLMLENNHGMRGEEQGGTITLIYNIHNDNRLLQVNEPPAQAIGGTANASLPAV